MLDCTYNNRQQQGAILVTKTRKHAADGSGPHPHEGVDFTVGDVTIATDENGEACFDGLSFGSHDVTETLPDGYHADQALTQAVLVDNNATCEDDPYAGETVAFGNTPLTDLSVVATGQVEGGTQSSIVCVDAAEENIGNAPVTPQRPRHDVGDRSRARHVRLPCRDRPLTCS